MNAAVLQQSPLHHRAARSGAQLAAAGGWQRVRVYTSVAQEVEAVRRGAGLADETANGKLLVEGREAAELLGVDLRIGAGASLEGGRVYRLRPDLFFLSTPPGEQEGILETLRARRAGRFLTLTDLTPGRAELRLAGPASPQVLSKLGGLDFEHFPDGEARQSSLAKTPQLILRRDLRGAPAFSLITARSLGAYLWDALLEAGREWHIAPIGQAALALLEDPSPSQGGRP